MKNTSKLYIIFLVLLLCNGCIPDQYAPTEGIWYCEDLHIQLSYETNEPSYIIINDEKVICLCGSDRGSDVILLICQHANHPNYEMGELLFAVQVLERNESVLIVYSEKLDKQFSFNKIA